MTTQFYALIESRPGHANFGKPLYVGIGTKGQNRPLKHIYDARGTKGCRNRLLNLVMRDHFAAGVEPTIEILASFEDREEACEAERAAIIRYGRLGRDEGGTLCNVARGGDGPDSTIMGDPEIRAKISEASKNASPEVKAIRIEALYRSHADPEIKMRRLEGHGGRVKDSWADPEIRRRRTTALKGVKKTMTTAALEARRKNARAPKSEEAKKAQRDAVERNWADPEFRAKRSRNQSAAWADPEKRANMLEGRKEGISKSWSDPDVRARRIAGIKAAALRKRELSETGHDA